MTAGMPPNVPRNSPELSVSTPKTPNNMMILHYVKRVVVYSVSRVEL